jgi:hypothetical protein
LTSSAALTSIFSFFFGGYFLERESADRLWLMFVAYGKELTSVDEKIDICSELESRHAKKNNHRYIVDIPRIYPPRADYFLSITPKSGKKSIYGWTIVRVSGLQYGTPAGASSREKELL